MNRSFYPGWWQVAVALIAQAVGTASVYTTYSIVVAPLSSEFQASATVLMLGMTIVSLLTGILSPFIGQAIDRFSLKYLMALGGVLLSIGFFSLSFAQSMTHVLLVYGLFMAASAVLLGPMAGSALLARWFSKRRGMAMSIAASGGAIGGFLLPPLLQWLIGDYEWRMALRIYAALVFVATVPVILLLLVNHPREKNVVVEGSEDLPNAGATATALPADDFSLKSAVAHPNFWLIAILQGCLYFGPVAVVSNMVQFVGTKGIDATQAALLLSLLSAANFIGKLICASVIDKLNMRTSVAVLVVATMAYMGGFLVADTYFLMAAMILVCGLVQGAVMPVWSLVISRVYCPQRFGKVMGLLAFILMPFTMAAPPVFGWIYDTTKSYDNGLLAVIALLVLSLLLLTQLKLNSTQKPTPAAGTGEPA